MNKCPKCNNALKETFNEMMDRVLRECNERMRKELGFGVPDKEEDKIKFDKPKIFKGELDHVERES